MDQTATAKLRVERSSEIFGHRLREFVERWAPVDRDEVFDFQQDMMRIMFEAMHHKSDCLSLGIATYADAVFTDMAMRPLRVIVEEPKR